MEKLLDPGSPPDNLVTAVCNRTKFTQAIFYKSKIDDQNWSEHRRDIPTKDCAILGHDRKIERYVVVGTKKKDGSVLYDESRIVSGQYFVVVEDKTKKIFSIQQRPIEEAVSALTQGR